MSALHSRSPEFEAWKRPLALSIGATVLYSAGVFGYSLLPMSNVSYSGTFWDTLAVFLTFGLVTIGIPVFLWLRYTIRSPATLLVVILIFWHILVYIPPIATGRGDSPAFMFVFAWAPVYLVVYALLATIEYWLRGRSASASPGR